jgi:hypothetical protein
MAETPLPTGTAEVAGRHDRAQWRAKVTREAYAADVDEYRRRYGKAEGERRFFAENAPADVKEEEGNVLTTAGITAIWNALTQGTAGAFQNATAALGVGDSATAETAAQTNLQAATNAFRQAMDATFPTVSGATVTFKATFGTGNANFTWAEWAVFSAVGSGSPPTGGTMLNRKTAALGTKTSAASWAFTVTITLS